MTDRTSPDAAHPTDHEPRPVAPPVATNAFCARCGYFPLPLEGAHPIPWDWPGPDAAPLAGEEPHAMESCPTCGRGGWCRRCAEARRAPAPPLDVERLAEAHRRAGAGATAHRAHKIAAEYDRLGLEPSDGEER